MWPAVDCPSVCGVIPGSENTNIMYQNFKTHLEKELQDIKDAGLYKNERIITTPQSSDIKVAGTEGEVLNFCANNYLGLADNSRLVEAAKAAMDNRGYGMSSVRFICGTQDLHKELEKSISDYFKTEDTILYAACFDANGCSSLFSPRRMRLSATRSTMPRSSTACVFARLSASVTRMPTWQIWSVACRRQRTAVSA